MASTSEYRGLGLNGGEYINNTVSHTGTFFAIQATEDTVLAAQASNITNLDDICTGQDATNIVCRDGTVRKLYEYHSDEWCGNCLQYLMTQLHHIPWFRFGR